MGDHVVRSDFVDHHLERSRTDVQQDRSDTTLIFLQGLFVIHAGGLRVVLSLAEATIIAPQQNLRLRASLALAAENVQIRIAGDAVKSRLVLFTITHRSASPQIKRDGTGYRKAALNRWINGRIHGRCPTPA